jgi:hypothetical protein
LAVLLIPAQENFGSSFMSEDRAVTETARQLVEQRGAGAAKYADDMAGRARDRDAAAFWRKVAAAIRRMSRGE